MVTTQRPRLWITQATLPALKARAVASNDRWMAVKQAADAPADWSNGLVNLLLAYQMTGDGSYAAKAWSLMSDSMKSGLGQITPDSGYQARNYLPSAALVYDWLHDWMSDAQKKQLQADLEACCDWTWPETNPARKGAWGVADPGGNYYHGFLFTWMAGLALAGESPKAQGYLDNARRRWDTEVVPYLNIRAAGGLFAEGTGYGTASMGFILWNLLAHFSATEEDLTKGDWFISLVHAMYHFANPAKRELAPFGDLGAGPINDYHRRVMLCLGELSWLNAATPNRNQQRLTQWEEFLGQRNLVLPAPTETFYSAPGIGAISSRTGWGKADTQLLTVCGPTTQSHQDRAQGTFYLSSGDWLAASAKMFSHSGIRQDCWDHNCLSVDGKPQAWTQDGCRYLAQEDTPSYTFLRMDLTAAYSASDPRLDQFITYTRELFFLKPNLLVVRDVFTPTNPAAVVTHNLNVLAQPVLDLTGGFAVVTPSGSKLFGVASDWKFVSRQAMMDQNQTTPTYQLVLTGAGAPRYCVGLEIAPAPQGARSVTPYASTALQGMVRGSDLVAAVTLPPPLNYTSPTNGNHWLYGLKPSTVYTVNDIQWTTSPAGVLHVPGPSVGSVVRVSEGGPPPPPHGRLVQLFIPTDGSPITVTEMPASKGAEE